MATFLPPLFLFLLLSSFSHSKPLPNLTSPYLSPLTFLPNYHQMLTTFKIFIYSPPSNLSFQTPTESLFHSSLLKSPFLTSNPNLAHLFYLSLPSQNPRSISRSIRDLRSQFPFWNQTLGADHFYLSSTGISFESDRNLVELKKNSIQISCFPTSEGKFIPHKDLTLPPLSRNLHSPLFSEKKKFLGFFHGGEKESKVLDKLRGDRDFVIESGPLDSVSYVENLSSSRFCLFLYGIEGDLSFGEALRFGCVPVVITDRPIIDLPFNDVLRWAEIAVFVGGREVKSVLERTCGERYEKMRDLGIIASRHFAWNLDLDFNFSQEYEYDAFHTVLYQLWKRRHTIRYARRDSVLASG
ncbi:putative glycosyltransferase At5g03795 [Tasmannia lanceolata]|uniref:putative glycosyltransferase At5g03795 n=1 Tax=Tasmannia lanceolata TaxID=3420 RepID=UPI004063C869